ncbi:MnhB domain-containing protein [Natronoarchaeum mannanilyticum]|uniref:Na+/H+ antiporter MnhB subunit-related protein domain-containing protein n=1 Tax=Natronoarchaeum mannanilyticum TaxID=926360 RepID=A0AAV3T7P0_9EURY
MTTVVMKTTVRVVVPIVLVVAISLLLQGHNLPGGGFVGGVLTTAAFALIYVAYGLDYLEIGVLGRDVESGAGMFEHRSVEAYLRTFVLGLALAVGSGLGGLAFGEPFLTQDHWTIYGVPIYGDIHLASALAFDVGVYLVVVGGLLTILSVVGAE